MLVVMRRWGGSLVMTDELAERAEDEEAKYY